MSSAMFEFEANPNPVPASERAALLENPGFGKLFTDHMAMVRWSDTKGWHDAKVVARGPLSLDPATAVLHYAQEIFEGLKAYRTGDEGTALFRPLENARRFRESAQRMAMPELPDDLFLGSIEALVKAGVRVIDIAADFRIKDIAEWERWYKMTHACPDIVAEAVYGLPDTFFNEYVPKIQAVTVADAQAAARKYVQPDKFAIVVVGDLAKIEKGIRDANFAPVKVLSVDEIVK